MQQRLFSYDDICLQPKHSVLKSRDEADTVVDFLGYKYALPVIPANMEDVISLENARQLSKDGYFYIYDRKRDLIKYKGLRVYAREVEEVLKSHPHIKDVGVIGQKDVKVGELVKAMVVLESDARGKLSELEIMEYCKDKMAHYKIPKIVEFIGEIPQTDVGKVSRRELREEEAKNDFTFF